MKFRLWIIVCLFLGFCHSRVPGQTKSHDEFSKLMKIVPIASTAKDVQKLLGDPIDKSPDFYKLADHNVMITYASGLPCDNGCYEKGRSDGWNVPRDTVITVAIFVKSPFHRRYLKNFGIDLSKYKKSDDADHIPKTTYYSSAEEGIGININGDQVNDLAFFPAVKYLHFRCPETNNKLPCETRLSAPRPFLEFLCPSYPLAARRKMYLQAEIQGAKETMGEEGANGIGYKWSASGAKIVSGLTDRIVTIKPQRTPSQQKPFDVDVTVRISGLPPYVENERTCSIRIDPACKQPRLFARYYETPLHNEDVILDSLAKHLKNYGSREVAYIVVYRGRSACAREGEWRADRAQRYLVANHKIQRNRITAVDGGFRDALTVEIFTSPLDSCGPFPTPSRLPSTAHIRGFCEEKYANKK